VEVKFDSSILSNQMHWKAMDHVNGCVCNVLTLSTMSSFVK
jgi:hypothetical protein